MTNKQALREAAVRAGGEKWHYVRTSVHSKAYITNEKGETVVNCTDGDAPAKCAVFIELANPATVLALLDELEAAQSYAKERDEENQDLMLTIGRLRVERETIESERDNALCELLPGVQYMDPPDGGCVTPMEQVRRMVADYRERIAELESRKAKLPSFEGYAPHIANELQAAFRIACATAGIRINGEG